MQFGCTFCMSNRKGLINVHFSITLHARGAKFLSCEEDGVVVILSISSVLLLLQEGPATHVLQTLRWVPQFNQTHGLTREGQKHTQTHREKGKRI